MSNPKYISIEKYQLAQNVVLCHACHSSMILYQLQNDIYFQIASDCYCDNMEDIDILMDFHWLEHDDLDHYKVTNDQRRKIIKRWDSPSK